jgi:hypothetical protein
MGLQQLTALSFSAPVSARPETALMDHVVVSEAIVVVVIVVEKTEKPAITITITSTTTIKLS